MSVNILDLFNNQVEGTLAPLAAGFLGESESSTRNVLETISPTLLGGVVQKGSTELGASSVLNMLKQDNYDTFVLNELSGLTADDGSKMNNIMNMGLPIVRSLLGDKVEDIIQWIAAKHEVKENSVSSLMSLAAPFLMGILGRVAKADNLNSEGLVSLLNAQSPYIRSLLPAGLASITNYTALNNPPPFTTPDAPVYAPIPDTVNVNTSRPASGGGLGNFLPWLLLIIGIGLLWYFMRGCNDPDVDDARDNTEVIMDSTKEDIKDAVDTIKDGASEVAAAFKGKVDDLGNWVSDLGKDYTVILPNKKELKVNESSIERNLVEFINSGTTDEEMLKNKWFSFDRLYFRSEKSELVNSSKKQLDNIADILKAYPKVNIKMGGYTDSDGEESMNQKLSQERAETAKNELQKRGVGGNRIEAEGYGEQFPRCPDNDTRECKSQNRRIDIRITKM